jgi:hypothetical protein
MLRQNYVRRDIGDRKHLRMTRAADIYDGDLFEAASESSSVPQPRPIAIPGAGKQQIMIHRNGYQFMRLSTSV